MLYFDQCNSEPDTSLVRTHASRNSALPVFLSPRPWLASYHQLSLNFPLSTAPELFPLTSPKLQSITCGNVGRGKICRRKTDKRVKPSGRLRRTQGTGILTMKLCRRSKTVRGRETAARSKGQELRYGQMFLQSGDSGGYRW